MVPPAPDAVLKATAEPTAMRREWWPAAVRIPGSPAPIYTARVIAADAGLFVYIQGRGPAGEAQVQLKFSAPVNYSETPPPPSDYASVRAGLRIPTEVGEVIVQPLASCGCSYKTLKRWRPDWATRNQAWES